MKDLTQGPEGKQIFQFAVPMLLGNVFQQLYNIINAVVVGRFIGKEALAAVGASFPLIFMLISFIFGITTGATIIISQYFGAKELGKVRQTIDTLYVFLFLASVIVTLAGILLSSFIFRLIDLPPDIRPDAILYLNIFLLGSVFFFGFNGTSAILRGLGDSRTPLVFLIISTVCNIGLDLLFVIVFKWGIAGVAISTILSQAGAFITAIVYLNKKHEIVKIRFKHLNFDKDIFIKSIRIGLPSGLQQTFVALGMIALFGIVNPFGTDTIAAYSVAGRIDSFATIPAMNFSIALSAFVGQNLGANKPERVRRGFTSTLWMTSVIAVTMSAVAILFGSQIMGLFTDDQNIISIGHKYLIIVSSFYIVFSAMFIVGGVMRGAGDTLIPMFITLFSLWIIRIPFSYFLSRKIGVEGIWWGIPIAWAIGLLFSYIYYKTGRWKLKVVVRHSPPPEELPE
ncbi:MAG: MATE family efflux transporter [Bacteroidetes bacterium]|nr:MATE family efflux transporter [Bacteroidota bacterium]